MIAKEFFLESICQRGLEDRMDNTFLCALSLFSVLALLQFNDPEKKRTLQDLCPLNPILPCTTTSTIS